MTSLNPSGNDEFFTWIKAELLPEIVIYFAKKLTNKMRVKAKICRIWVSLHILYRTEHKNIPRRE